MRLSISVMCAVIVSLCSGCAHRTRVAAAQAPVVVADIVRESLPNDYMRVSFLAPGTPVTTLSKPSALRAFATATSLYVPPLKVADYPYYSGLANNDSSILVAMRCRPPHPEKVDAVLATWPNVFLAIQRDLPNPVSCSPAPPEPAAQLACYARAFTDPASTAVPAALAHTFSYAGALYEPANAPLAQWLQSNYGVYPAFAGTGYSVKDSYSLDKEPMTSQQILAKSVSSEYLLKNVSLAAAGCRCISVPPYTGRSDAPIDPAFIQQAGGDGICTTVQKLAAAH